MTDKKTETSHDDRARSKSPVLTTPASKRVPPPGTPDAEQSSSGRRSRSILAPVALVLALIAVGLAGSVWVQHQQIKETQAQLASNLASNESSAGRVSTQVSDALARLGTHDERIDSLQGSLNEATAIIQDLDEALRTMTDRGSELVLLNDVDHLATIAQQQLQLGGNVRNAIVALESAQAQLARANRPALASLLQTVNGDIDRLRAASTIDVGAFSQQLEELAVLLTEAPLIMPDEAGRQAERQQESAAREQPAPTVPPASEAQGQWWEHAWDTARDWSRDALGSLRSDLGEFIDVRRVDDASALLMSPDQSARFRENLRTRVMTAQLALMMRQPEIWKAETEAVVKALETRYDAASPLTRKALRLARNMADASIDAQLPSVDNTLQAISSLREAQARQFHGVEQAGSQPEGLPETQNGANGSGDASREPSDSPIQLHESTTGQAPGTPDGSAGEASPARAGQAGD